MALPLVMGAVIALRVRLLTLPLDRDEGGYAYVGQLILRGVPPYVSAYDFKMPGIYATYAAILAIFGQSPAGVHLGLLVANAAGTVLVFALGWRLLRPAGAVGAAATFAVLSLSPRVLGFSAYPEHFVLVPALAGGLSLLTASRPGRRRWFVVSGILFGAAMLIKQSGIAFVIFGAVVAALYAGRRGVWRLSPPALVLAAAALPYALTCLGFALAGAFEKFWFWTVVYARHFAMEQSLLFALAAARDPAERILPGMFPAVALAVGGAVALWRIEVAPRERAFIGLLAGFGVLSAAAGLHFRPHYFVLALPGVALLVGVAADAVARRVPTRMRVLGPAAAFGVVLLPLAWLLVSDRDLVLERSPERVSRAIYGTNPFPESATIARFLETHAAPDDRIAVMGSEPQIYFYARRPAATGHVYMYALMEAHPYAARLQREMIAEIEAARPRFVVLVNVAASWTVRPGSDRTLFRWWDEYQRDFDRVGFIDIFPDATGYTWGAPAAHIEAKSPVWIAVFERRTR